MTATAPARPSLVTSAAANYVTLGVNVLVGVVLTPFIIAVLGKSAYGMWGLLGAVVGYFGLVELGIGTAVIKHVAVHLGQGDAQRARRTILAALVMFSLLAVVMLAASHVLAPVLGGFFRLEPGQPAIFERTLVLLVVGLAVALLESPFAAALQGSERFVTLNGIASFAALLRLGLSFAALDAGLGLPGLAWAVVASSLIRLALLGWCTRSMLAPVSGTPPVFERALFRALVTYSASVAVLAVASRVAATSAVVISGRMLTVAEVALVALAMMVLGYLVSVVAAAMGPLLPRFAHLIGAGRDEELRRSFLGSLFFSGAMSFGLAAGLVVCIRPLLEVWVGPGFDRAFVPFACIGVAYAAAAAQIPMVHVLQALGRHHWYAALVAVEALANVLLSLILARHLGLLGVALGTAISHLAVRGIAASVYACRVTRIPVAVYWSALAPSLAGGAAAVGLGLALAPGPESGPLTGLLAGGAVAAFTYLAGLGVAWAVLHRLGLGAVDAREALGSAGRALRARAVLRAPG